MKLKDYCRGVVALGFGLVAASSASALSLGDAVRQTLSTNPDVLFSINERLSRGQEVQQARAGYYPSIDLTAGVGRERSDNPSTQAAGLDHETLTRQEIALNLRQMLYDGRATKSEVERQKARVNAAAYTVYGTSEDTALQAAGSFLEVLRRQEQRRYAQENLAAHERIFDQIELRSQAGVGRKADLDQVKGRRALAQTNLVAAENNLNDARTNYLRVVGEAPEGLERSEVPQNALPSSLQAALDLAIANHPTLQSAQADVAAAIAQHRAARHTFYPRFDLEIGRTWNEDLDGQEGDDEELSAMLRMRYNLFNGGADVARKDQTAHLVEASKDVRSRTHRQVVETMRLSWNAYQATQMQLKHLKQHVESSERTREAYAKQFNIGQRTLLDLLDTENELFDARRAFVDGDHDHLFAQYRILAAMGKLLETLGVGLPDEARPFGE